LVVITRGLGSSYCYDLMSDRLELTMLGRNYFRVNEVTSDFIATWSSCYYVGETVKSHEEIEALGLPGPCPRRVREPPLMPLQDTTTWPSTRAIT